MENPALRTLLFQMELSRRRLIQPWFSALGLTLGQGQPRILARLLQGDGLTQRELGERIGISGPAVAMWETGENRPSLTNLEKLADVLGVSIDAILGRDSA